MDFVKKFSIDGLDCGRKLFIGVMYKLSVRVVKSGISFFKNMSKYIVIFMCILLVVAGVFMVYSLTCRGLVCVFLPFRSEMIGR